MPPWTLAHCRFARFPAIDALAYGVVASTVSLEVFAQEPYRGEAEQIRDGHLTVGEVTEPGMHLDREQRVPAQIVEIVVEANCGDL